MSCSRTVSVTRSRTLATAGGRRAAIGSPRDAGDPAFGIARPRPAAGGSRGSPHQVEAAHPDPLDDLRARIARRCRTARPSGRTRSHVWKRFSTPRTARAPAGAACSRARSPTSSLPTLVHHERGVPLEQRHHRLGPFEDLTLLGREQTKDAARRVRAVRASSAARSSCSISSLGSNETVRDTVDHPARATRGAMARTENCTRCVTSWIATHSRKSRGGRPYRALHLDQVRTDEVEQPLVVGRQEHVELPEHPART